jgi:hypothetical protein
MDTVKSDQIVQRFRHRAFKSKRTSHSFSGTWETTVEELFPLFCPTREADWIPGWDCELVYTGSGYAEQDCVFKTGQSNPAGAGLWVFAGYKVNQYVDFVRVQEDVVVHTRVTVSDNHDGTVTATWDTVSTGLTEKGNEQVARTSERDPHAGALIKMIEHYLKTGETIKRSSLILGMAAQSVRGHFS